jgi:hypothetical protein
VSRALDQRSVRSLAADQIFEEVRHHASEDDAAEHPIGLVAFGFRATPCDAIQKTAAAASTAFSSASQVVSPTVRSSAGDACRRQKRETAQSAADGGKTMGARHDIAPSPHVGCDAFVTAAGQRRFRQRVL